MAEVYLSDNDLLNIQSDGETGTARPGSST